MKAKNIRYMDWAKSQLKLIYQEVKSQLLCDIVVFTSVSLGYRIVKSYDWWRECLTLLDSSIL